MNRLFLLLLLFCAAQTHAQNGRVVLKVSGNGNEPVPAATAELRLAGKLVKLAVTDEKGVAEFEKLVNGAYTITISALNYAPQSITAEISESQNLAQPAIILLPAAVKMETATVTGNKPFIQKLTDRIVVNVNNSIVNAGNSAFEVLERSPGVNIDQNDVISLRGKAGVIVMIDGKPTPMSGADLANYLRGLNAAAIDRIEIITNPSARYDAAGNSGIIDIRMKKDQRLGTNGTANAGYGQGVYAKSSAGLSFNHRNKNLNLFGNYNFAYRIGLNHLLLDRSFYENGVYSGGDKKDNYAKMPFTSNALRVGADFFPSKNTILGIVASGNFTHFKRQNDNFSTIIDPLKEPQSTFESLASNNDHNNNYLLNLNVKHSFKGGREFSADADYGFYKSSSLTRNATRYYRLDGSSLQPDYVLDGDQRGELSFKTAKADYIHPLKNNAKWEAGVKGSYVSSDNDAQFFDVSSGTPQNDVNKTNHFLYHETNLAAYINFAKQYKKFDLQLGLRAERTDLSTEQKMGNVVFDSGYLQLFPSAFLNYQLGKEKTIGLSVSRRIDRPGYGQLNPFLFLIDVTTYATGKPGLLPQLTWSYEASYTVKGMNFALSYSHTRDVFNITLARFREVFPNIPSPPNVTVQVPINLSGSDYFGLTMNAPVRINKWWNMINNGTVFYQRYKGNFSGTQLNEGKPTADLRTNNTFTLKKGWTAELNASFNSGTQSGFLVFDPQWALGFGVQKQVLKNKGTVRFNMSDIFWTNRPRAVVTFNNYVEKWEAYRESRVANLTFSYRFGNNKVQAARRRTTASEEERQRAGS